MLQKCSIWKVFSVFLENPEKRWQVREISRKIALAHTSVRLHLDDLIKEKLILEKDDAVFKYLIANQNEKFRLYQKIRTLAAHGTRP